ncbi:MAG: hypothetical protein GYA14_06815 [Ignavibacteria bacterium]|nr:hypothetical protein [Ignavibacteria bacterium]
MSTPNLPLAVVGYLNKYGSDIWSVKLKSKKHYDNVIVVPAIAEYDNISKLLNSLGKNDKKYFDRTLVLFVINCSGNAPDEIKRDNEKTIEMLNRSIHSNEMNIGYVNASSPGLYMPEKDAGVGLARKIGMDLSLSLFDYSSPNKKLIICLDADCEVDSNYLTTIVDSFNNRNMNAAVIEYEHSLPDNELERSAIISYEIFLRYYVIGLAYAKSPYAFHTVGSTMACDHQTYIRVGGMNKRKAAEDFYFLEKLAKVVSINKINGTKVYPSNRTSWRVPFGTGQRMNRFKAGTHDEYSLFNPELFEILAAWNKIFFSNKRLAGKEYILIAGEIEQGLKRFLEINSFEEQWDKILGNAKSESQICKQKKTWFDGFRTLKLIHYLRDNGHPNINMFTALDILFNKLNLHRKINREENIPPVDVQLGYLKQLKEAEALMTGGD